MKTALIFGTRPEIIKLSPIIRALQRRKLPFVLLHTGQHYSYDMDRIFFRDLELPEPQYQLNGRSLANEQQGEHAGRMLTDILPVLKKEKPRAVLVQGDTNSVLAGAMAASKTPGVLLGHVEAGLRSYDRRMPEEVNRVLTDHLSDLLFAPTPESRSILLSEHVPAANVFVTGNTIVDAVHENLEIARKHPEPALLREHKKNGYMLLTMHRAENVDDRQVLASILSGLARVAKRLKLPILFPAHPRTVSRLKGFGLKVPAGVRVTEPVGFLDFLRFEASARLILTDSGGLQEEACILRVPCVTLRTNTERPETITVGSNVLAGYDPSRIESSALRMLNKKRRWANPFGDGRAGERIVSLSKRRA